MSPFSARDAIDIRTWAQNVDQHASENVNRILIGNKCDWEEKRAVQEADGQNLADELGIPFLEVSAKTGQNISKAFESLAADIKERIEKNSKAAESNNEGVAIDQDGSGISRKCC